MVVFGISLLAHYIYPSVHIFYFRTVRGKGDGSIFWIKLYAKEKNEKNLTKIKCGKCKKLIRVTSIHSGFDDTWNLYCERCPIVCILDIYGDYPEVSRIFKDNLNWRKSKKVIENSLKRCSCGGKFLFKASPRCPYCNSILSRWSWKYMQPYYLIIEDKFIKNNWKKRSRIRRRFT